MRKLAFGYSTRCNIRCAHCVAEGDLPAGRTMDHGTAQKSIVQMAQAGVGVGLGIQDIRVVFVFHSAHALDSFIFNGWEFGGQADVAAKARDKGSSATGEVSIDAETTIYTMSESGLIAKVNLTGTKYWKDENLNF